MARAKHMSPYERTRLAINAGIRLNQFATVVAVLEECLPGGSKSAYRTAQKIINLCQAEQQRQLEVMDRFSGRNGDSHD